MLQRLTQTLLNNRLCVNMPLLVEGSQPPFLYVSIHYPLTRGFQLSKLCVALNQRCFPSGDSRLVSKSTTHQLALSRAYLNQSVR